MASAYGIYEGSTHIRYHIINSALLEGVKKECMRTKERKKEGKKKETRLVGKIEVQVT